MPVSCRNCSQPRWTAVPSPAVAMLSAPGFDFASATSSFTLLAGRVSETTSSKEVRDEVRWASGGVGDDDTDGTLRILLRVRMSSNQRCGRDGSHSGQKRTSIYLDHDFRIPVSHQSSGASSRFQALYRSMRSISG